MSTNITITGKLTDFAAGNDTAAGVAFRLVNWLPGPARVSGTSVIAQTYLKPTISGTGTFSQAMYGNDQINPNSTSSPPQTYYEFVVYDDSGAILYVAAYQFTGSGSFDISTLTPITQPFIGGAAVALNPPNILTSLDFTAQSAAIATTTLFAVVNAGQYRLTWVAKVTTAATTGAATSQLGALTIVSTVPDGVAQTVTAVETDNTGTLGDHSTTNTTTTAIHGVPLMMNCKGATNITYAFNYASNTASQMQYNLHLRLESM